MTAAQISEGVKTVQVLGDAVLETLKVVDPRDEVPVELAEAVMDPLSRMVVAAIEAFTTAAGTPITAASIEALLPSQTPLTAPPEQGG